jgi:hypothetical protein
MEDKDAVSMLLLLTVSNLLFHLDILWYRTTTTTTTMMTSNHRFPQLLDPQPWINSYEAYCTVYRWLVCVCVCYVGSSRQQATQARRAYALSFFLLDSLK